MWTLNLEAKGKALLWGLCSPGSSPLASMTRTDTEVQTPPRGKTGSFLTVCPAWKDGAYWAMFHVRLNRNLSSPGLETFELAPP